jgi:hypothetical protein
MPFATKIVIGLLVEREGGPEDDVAGQAAFDCDASSLHALEKIDVFGGEDRVADARGDAGLVAHP